MASGLVISASNMTTTQPLTNASLYSSSFIAMGKTRTITFKQIYDLNKETTTKTKTNQSTKRISKQNCCFKSNTNIWNASKIENFTMNPSISPTVVPTTSPTYIPFDTEYPTENPSMSRSYLYTPTMSPINNPSVTRSKYPTLQPTIIPTNKATINPTYNATPKPSQLEYNPSISPSNVPGISLMINTINATKIPAIEATYIPKYHGTKESMSTEETSTNIVYIQGGTNKKTLNAFIDIFDELLYVCDELLSVNDCDYWDSIYYFIDIFSIYGSLIASLDIMGIHRIDESNKNKIKACCLAASLSLITNVCKAANDKAIKTSNGLGTWICVTRFEPPKSYIKNKTTCIKIENISLDAFAYEYCKTLYYASSFYPLFIVLFGLIFLVDLIDDTTAPSPESMCYQKLYFNHECFITLWSVSPVPIIIIIIFVCCTFETLIYRGATNIFMNIVVDISSKCYINAITSNINIGEIYYVFHILALIYTHVNTSDLLRHVALTSIPSLHVKSILKYGFFPTQTATLIGPLYSRPLESNRDRSTWYVGTGADESCLLFGVL